ncbi:CLC_0170 family protein [Halothermothrix orenii]|uniref:CLC_0170 family protein n=1 Tax=Halothermothrix orenii TaxID=31909 RepID=UPI0002E606DE|nr:CLC_0170 family protein [Halothermothrix orenii]
MDLIISVLDFIKHQIYTPYLPPLFIICGLLAFFGDTNYANFYGHNKDFVFSFFLGLLNILAGLLLILVSIIHTRYVF